MKPSYIMAIDQGTTSTRAMIFDREGQVVGWHQLSHRQTYPHPGWVSHDAGEIYVNVAEAGRQAIARAGISPKELLCAGITNQRETTVLWDKNTGEPVMEAVVWQCRRSAGLCEQMVSDGMSEMVHQKTGLLIDPYFSATKMQWILSHSEQARRLRERGELLAGTMDSFLIWKLTKGKQHVTDYTNASRTLLFNLSTLQWDEELMTYFGITRAMLPTPQSCVGEFGVADASVWGAPIPITGVAGDQHAALFGQTCFNEGDVKNTYGTGCFLLKNIGATPKISQGQLLSTLAWHIDGKPTYALEGSVFNAGAAVTWLIKEMKLAANTEEISHWCAQTPDTDGTYFVPAFTGLGAPYWDSYARGVWCGLSLSTNRRHMVRAVIESVAYQSRDVIDYMTETSGLALPVLRVDGGVCKNDFAMQFQADILQVPVERPQITETTAQGVFYLAGLGAGFFTHLEELTSLRSIDRVFTPKSSAAEANHRYRRWRKAVDRARNWAED